MMFDSFYSFVFFFFNDTATTEIYTLSLHDALPISVRAPRAPPPPRPSATRPQRRRSVGAPTAPHPGDTGPRGSDRKSTRLNSSHANISYAVFCLKKKKNKLYANTLRTQVADSIPLT